MRVWLVMMFGVALTQSVGCGSSAAETPSIPLSTASVPGTSGAGSTAPVTMNTSTVAGSMATAIAGQRALLGDAGAGAVPSSVAGTAAPSQPPPGFAGSAPSAGSAGIMSTAGNTALTAGTGAAGTASETPSGPAVGCPAQPLAAGDHMFTLKSANKMTYTYYVHVPMSVDPMKRTPVIFKWHAYTSNPKEFRMLEKVDEIADKAGTIMVYPESPDGAWDTGSCCDFTGVKRNEETFARELYKEVLGKVCADEKRIYTTGLSNGAMMSQMLACKMSDVFAAAATVVGTLTIPKAQCTPKRPIPIFMINGTSDPLVGYNRPGLAGGLSVPDDYAFWAEKNKCTGEPETTLEKGKASCKTYKTCAAEVSYCVAEGMGHCMPGMVKESDSNCLTHGTPLGPPNDDLDGVQMSSDFMLRFTLP